MAVPQIVSDMLDALDAVDTQGDPTAVGLRTLFTRIKTEIEQAEQAAAARIEGAPAGEPVPATDPAAASQTASTGTGEPTSTLSPDAPPEGAGAA